MTPEQRLYSDFVNAGKSGDLLKLISADLKLSPVQSYCSVNNGFLFRGRRLIPTLENRIRIRSPARCVDFGTDGMIGMLEWLGRRVRAQYSDPQYQGVRLIVGDISAPRGGCLSGRSGRRGHASHTSGRDVDLGFLTVRASAESPVDLHRQFDAKANWWLIKNLFQNPYACVKVVFLDRRLISKLAKVASVDPDWARYRGFVRHVKSHRNHFHIRIGDTAGPPGCRLDGGPDLDDEEEELGDEMSDSPESTEFINSLIQQNGQ